MKSAASTHEKVRQPDSQRVSMGLRASKLQPIRGTTQWECQFTQGAGYPAWKLAVVNHLKDKMIADIMT